MQEPPVTLVSSFDRKYAKNRIDTWSNVIKIRYIVPGPMSQIKTIQEVGTLNYMILPETCNNTSSRNIILPDVVIAELQMSKRACVQRLTLLSSSSKKPNGLVMILVQFRLTQPVQLCQTPTNHRGL